MKCISILCKYAISVVRLAKSHRNLEQISFTSAKHNFQCSPYGCKQPYKYELTDIPNTSSIGNARPMLLI